MIRSIYRKLYSRFGPQRWWPGETPFEVAVGAILTQNTSWANAHRAVLELKRSRLLDPVRLARVPQKRLAKLIRSSGCFNQKAKRLRAFSQFVNKTYGGKMARMRRAPAEKLREELLGVSGIGPETADSILLYALDKPVFVVDAYTRRILARHSLVARDASYDRIKDLFEKALPREQRLFNEYHALIVATGKGHCRRSNPGCPECPLREVGRLALERN
ncbi:MAG: endonuclease III domain-containing protein [Candidatus Omnitrophica bacterium]|nr:endonuclease III domain-containing protein [Candidatus Omnitrophota bacterium]